MERAAILCEQSEISADILAIDNKEGSPVLRSGEKTQDLSLEDYFCQFVLEHQDKLTETELARRLGISRKTLWERRQRFGIPKKKQGQGKPS